MHDPAPECLLQVDALACRRSERPLFAPVSFTLGAGEAIWLRGANGQGKTTLLRSLAGLAAREEGRIAWPAGVARPFAYVAHANALKDDLTAAEALRVLLELDGRAGTAADAGAALARLGVGAKQAAPVRTLSQGQKRRVALSRLAVPGQPRTWLLDEPFDALDAAGVAAVGELLGAHLAGGGALLLTSHLPLPERLAARPLDLRPPLPARALPAGDRAATGSGAPRAS